MVEGGNIGEAFFIFCPFWVPGGTIGSTLVEDFGKIATCIFPLHVPGKVCEKMGRCYYYYYFF